VTKYDSNQEGGPRREARPEWRDYKAGSLAGISVEGYSWTARSSLAIRIARTSHARTLVLAPLYLPRPFPSPSISRERKYPVMATCEPRFRDEANCATAPKQLMECQSV